MPTQRSCFQDFQISDDLSSGPYGPEPENLPEDFLQMLCLRAFRSPEVEHLGISIGEGNPQKREKNKPAHFLPGCSAASSLSTPINTSKDASDGPTYKASGLHKWDSVILHFGDPPRDFLHMNAARPTACLAWLICGPKWLPISF